MANGYTATVSVTLPKTARSGQWAHVVLLFVINDENYPKYPNPFYWTVSVQAK